MILNRYGAEIVEDLESDGHGRIRIRTLLSEIKGLSSAEWAPEVARYGLIAWRKTGRDPAAFENARIVYTLATGKTETVPARKLLRQYRTRTG